MYLNMFTAFENPKQTAINCHHSCFLRFWETEEFVWNDIWFCRHPREEIIHGNASRVTGGILNVFKTVPIAENINDSATVPPFLPGPPWNSIKDT